MNNNDQSPRMRPASGAAEATPRIGAPDVPMLSVEQFVALRDALASYSGVYFDSARQRMLEDGVALRLAATGLALPTYLAQLGRSSGHTELQQLAEHVVNHETLFFRNGPHMRALQEQVLPWLHRRKAPGEPIRIWSAGCATGEEAYSLAVIALETLGAFLSRPVEIRATDLSATALARARAGIYRERALSNLSPSIRQRYFQTRSDGWQVRDDVRALVHFEQLNLLEPFPAWTHGIDLIFCQNVTIYFQVATCRALMERFYTALPNQGMLFLGFSETLWHIFNGFKAREIAGGFVYYKESMEQADQPGDSMTRQLTRSPQTAPLHARTTSVAQPTHATRPQGTTPLVPATPAKQRGTALLPMRSLVPEAEEVLPRCRVLLAAGETDRALELLRTVPPDVSYTPQALVLIAQAHANKGELDVAMAEVQRALDLNPLLETGHLLLGMFYSQQGLWQEAAQQLERARYLDAEAPLISFHLAEAYRRLGRAEAAAREYRNALHKLDAHPPDTVIDGVAVGWLRATCQRYMQQLTTDTRE